MNQKEITKKAEGFAKTAKSSFKILDGIDEAFREADGLSVDDALDYAQKLAGAGNFILKLYAQAKSVRKREESNKYLSLKLNVASGVKFVNAVAEKESKHHAIDLRSIERVLESYYESAKTSISVCRMYLKANQEDGQINASI